jgi:hypothetical protein
MNFCFASKQFMTPVNQAECFCGYKQENKRCEAMAVNWLTDNINIKSMMLDDSLFYDAFSVTRLCV